MKTNVTYIISNIDKAYAFEWIATGLDKDKIELDFILINTGKSRLQEFLQEHTIRVTRLDYRGKKSIPGLIWKVYRHLKRNRTEVLHAHLFEGSIIGITAAWLARIPRRIYTRHHANYHHDYYPAAVKYDRLVNALSTQIIAISAVVADILVKKESVPVSKVHIIYHGFKLEKFSSVPQEDIDTLRQRYLPGNPYPVVGVISRYIELKGLQYIIPAFKKLLREYPGAVLLLANASGDYKSHVRALLSEIPAHNYKEIAFEENLFALYRLFDVFIHAPIAINSEAFGQTYIESLTSGVPLIATRSGIGNEILEDGYNCLVVPHKHSDAIYCALIKLIEDQKLKEQLVANGKLTVREKFSLAEMIQKLESLYLR